MDKRSLDFFEMEKFKIDMAIEAWDVFVTKLNALPEKWRREFMAVLIGDGKSGPVESEVRDAL